MLADLQHAWQVKPTLVVDDTLVTCSQGTSQECIVSLFVNSVHRLLQVSFIIGSQGARVPLL